MKHLYLLIFYFLYSTIVSAQESSARNSDPKQVQFVTSDIANFWIAFDSAKVNPSKSLEIYNSLYFDKGSAGLKSFKEVSIKTTDNFVAAVQKYALYYESIRSSSTRIETLKPVMYNSLAKFKELYPDVVFPNVYFLIGDMNSGGKSEKSGLLIGAEVNSADITSNFTNIYPPFVKVLKSLTISNIPKIVLHELVHYQQEYALNDNTVLSYAIKEGSADFITKLILGKSNNELIFEYGEQHETELWNEFKTDLGSTEINKWFYNSAVGDRPGDLGYYIGFKITQAYYLKAKDKKQAINEILNVKNLNSFLKSSGYSEKFN